MGFVSSVFGQLLFGYLADKYGRTRLYGIELVLVIVSTIGVATTSNGYGDISFLALFTWVCSFDAALYLGWLSLCSPPVADDNGSGGL
jgi:MFS family permease